jgi:hypothetical protein
MLVSLDVDIHPNNEHVFQLSCRNGCIKIAKWLLISLGVDIHAVNECDFVWSRENGYIVIAKMDIS